MSSSSILSVEEMDALRDELMSQDNDSLERIDFATGDLTFRKRIPQAERRLLGFAKSVRMCAQKGLRQNHTIRDPVLEVVGPAGAMESLEAAAVVMAIEDPKMGVLGYVACDALLGFVLVERAFGAPVGIVGSGPREPQKELTDVERNTLLDFLIRVLEPFAKIWAEEGHEPPDFQYKYCSLSPEIEPTVETLLTWRVDVELGDRDSGVFLAMFPQFLERVDGARGERLVEQSSAWISDHLMRTQVQVSSDLGRITISMGELLALRPGDLLRIDAGREDLVRLAVESCTKFYGRPVQRNGANGVELSMEVV